MEKDIVKFIEWLVEDSRECGFENASGIFKGSKSSRNNKSKEGQRGLSKSGKHAILHGKHFKK